MDSERLAQIESLFIAALEHDDQAGFLDEACAGDLGLRHEVEALLDAHQDDQALAIENRFLADEPPEMPDPEALLGAAQSKPETYVQPSTPTVPEETDPSEAAPLAASSPVEPVEPPEPETTEAEETHPAEPANGHDPSDAVGRFRDG